MKRVSIMVACYNEEENVVQMSEALVRMFKNELPSYDYEILFIDNCSTDKTRILLRDICSKNKKIKAIFNIRNFGQMNSPYYGLLQTTGDCTVCMCCDFQDPVDLVPVFVREWEKGYNLVCGIRTKSKENPVLRFFRTCYYKLINKLSYMEQISYFSGFGLYDRSFIDILRTLDDPVPFLRGIVAEYGSRRKDIEYIQEKRRGGRTHNNFYTLYDAAMLSFTSYTKIGLRICVWVGFIMGVVSLAIGFFYLILKLLKWYEFSVGMAPVVVLVCLLGAIQLFFIGLIGEYVMNIQQRVMHRPLVIEEERINFDDDQDVK